MQSQVRLQPKSKSNSSPPRTNCNPLPKQVQVTLQHKPPPKQVHSKTTQPPINSNPNQLQPQSTPAPINSSPNHLQPQSTPAPVNSSAPQVQIPPPASLPAPPTRLSHSEEEEGRPVKEYPHLRRSPRKEYSHQRRSPVKGYPLPSPAALFWDQPRAPSEFIPGFDPPSPDPASPKRQRQDPTQGWAAGARPECW